jgi:hypothetical protein
MNQKTLLGKKATHRMEENTVSPPYPRVLHLWIQSTKDQNYFCFQLYVGGVGAVGSLAGTVTI